MSSLLTTYPLDPTTSHQTSPIITEIPPVPFGIWEHHVELRPTNFVHKSLSDFSVNIAVGCSHGCRFCFVPRSSTIKLDHLLTPRGVSDPDAEWGAYVFLRKWDEAKFIKSVLRAEAMPSAHLSKDGNRAVIYCSTTDAYQVFRHPTPGERKNLELQAEHMVRRSLEIIRDHSTLNVRILTRSPLARRDFDLFKSFGPRLLFGMSLPTLRDDLARVYEPKAPAPSQRLRTLQAAKAAGLNVYVAVAPTYPECNEADLRTTLSAVADLSPHTVFHEPINIRAENVARIAAHAKTIGVALRTDVFVSPESWQKYALDSLTTVQRVAKSVGLSSRLHLWPDKALGAQRVLRGFSPKSREEHLQWLQSWWDRISEWPTC